MISCASPSSSSPSLLIPSIPQPCSCYNLQWNSKSLVPIKALRFSSSPKAIQQGIGVVSPRNNSTLQNQQTPVNEDQLEREEASGFLNGGLQRENETLLDEHEGGIAVTIEKTNKKQKKKKAEEDKDESFEDRFKLRNGREV